jgi:murein DD-endopeptidase MepM/ murein hydrolase activator NlpD
MQRLLAAGCLSIIAQSATAQEKTQIAGGATSVVEQDLSAGSLLADEQAGLLLDKWGPAKPASTIGASNSSAEVVDPHQTTRHDTDPQRLARSSRLALSTAARVPPGASKMSSSFGMRVHPIFGDVRMHSGVDYAAPLGAPIAASSDGRVNSAGWSGGYGLMVAVDHGKGVQSRYAHLSKLNVAAGQRVRKGEIIGFVGSTGRSTGSHLHYEVRVHGQAVDPVRGRH